MLDPDDMPPRYAAQFQAFDISPAKVIVGAGRDDCAILQFGGDYLVLTTDYVNANPISVELGIAGPYDLGSYLVDANLSDLCGTGAQPIALLTGIMWARDRTEVEFELLVEGMKAASARAGVPIVGGDTKLGSRTVLSATAIGRAERTENLFLKFRAFVGQDIWVSGELGSCAAAALGLYKQVDMPRSWRDWARRCILQPTLPMVKSRAVSQLGLDCAGTDLSDGLGADLASLCQLSGVTAVVDLSAIPYAREVGMLASKLGYSPQQFAFTVGGDLQFLVTAPPSAADTLLPLGMTRIGQISDEGDMSVRMPSGAITKFPTMGHRDAHGRRFPDEVQYLLDSQEL